MSNADIKKLISRYRTFNALVSKLNPDVNKRSIIRPITKSGSDHIVIVPIVRSGIRNRRNAAR